jgi:hypothetical protein
MGRSLGQQSQGSSRNRGQYEQTSRDVRKQIFQFDLIATMLKKSTDQDENCCWVDVKDYRKTKFCDIPMSVQLILPSNGDGCNVEPLIMVRFEHSFRFDNPKGRKGWFCDSNLAQSVKHFHEKTSQDMASTGLSEQYVLLHRPRWLRMDPSALEGAVSQGLS